MKDLLPILEKVAKGGKPLKSKRNVRVYAGNYMVYYASIVEHAGKAFLRPALWNSRSEIKSILGAK